ncbi:DUF429 domain-containing protein [Vibrio tetraodonis]|uniref:DUF429 domain-containing protein n=1 Tax=Vibrio tetraodonis TaxID=2231647 RepID=UPI000E0A4ECC|nr:DUF429 domain-containing protein [Vibrio tetraodonis]
MRLAGVDLAWNGEKNTSAIAVGSLIGNKLLLEAVEPAILGQKTIVEYLSSQEHLVGVAIDAPLIINNQTGQRECEKALSRTYSARKAACHPSNQSLYPNPMSVHLSVALKEMGFAHLGKIRWQIECYPHPSIIECFGLTERLLYKKGNVADKRQGQVVLANLISELQGSPVLALEIPQQFKPFLTESTIQSRKGKALKSNEDTLDAIICLYIAALYQLNTIGTTYGDSNDGYIWVPQICCI